MVSSKNDIILAQINTGIHGSTGRIMCSIAHIVKEKNYGSYAYSRKWVNQSIAPENHKFFGSVFGNIIHRFVAQITGISGVCSFFATKWLVNDLRKKNVNIIHLHNLHGWYINLPVLFGFIKRYNIQTFWTLHDCWSFTGQCPHFIMSKCDKWKTGCHNCSQYKNYPESFVDNTKLMYKLKKKWFTGVENMTIVTPSQWLCDLVKQSFLKDYEVKVINNGIDLNVFKLTESNFIEEYNIKDKKIVFGCASPWSDRKGLDVFIKLSDMLSNDYKIVLVGLSKEQIKNLPKNIIGIERTNNQEELVKFYTMADVFVNPTREDNFPTVNIESLACGTPVITFDTGGSPEIIDETCGSVVECDDVESLKNEIVRICEEKPYGADACINRAKQFDMNNKFKEYVKLYETV